jgi:hypothetical protein
MLIEFVDLMAAIIARGHHDFRACLADLVGLWFTG